MFINVTQTEGIIPGFLLVDCDQGKPLIGSTPVLTIHTVPLPLVWLPLNLVIDLHRVILLSRAKSSIVLHCSGIKVKSILVLNVSRQEDQVPAGYYESETMQKLCDWHFQFPVSLSCVKQLQFKSLHSDCLKRALLPFSNFAFNWKLLQIELFRLSWEMISPDRAIHSKAKGNR